VRVPRSRHAESRPAGCPGGPVTLPVRDFNCNLGGLDPAVVSVHDTLLRRSRAGEVRWRGRGAPGRLAALGRVHWAPVAPRVRRAKAVVLREDCGGRMSGLARAGGQPRPMPGRVLYPLRPKWRSTNMRVSEHSRRGLRSDGPAPATGGRSGTGHLPGPRGHPERIADSDAPRTPDSYRNRRMEHPTR
jgi:hypothetical protein